MTSSHKRHHPLWSLLVGLAILACSGVVGCQVHTGGQTLPSPEYYSDDVQLYAPGAEFKLANEAAAMKAHRSEPAAETPKR
jgi:hypothetical protein